MVNISLSPQELWKVVATLATAGASVLGAGFLAGLKYQESQSNVAIAEAKGSLAQSQAKLEASQSRLEQISAQLTQWQSAYQNSQTELAQQQQIVASLTAQLGRANNCSFIHEQIVATQKLIENPGGILLFDPNGEAKERDKERIASLQRRLNAYQQMLGTCNK